MAEHRFVIQIPVTVSTERGKHVARAIASLRAATVAVEESDTPLLGTFSVTAAEATVSEVKGPRGKP